MRPHFLLILGAMKTGTTALYGALALHPGVLPALEKEPVYWLKDEALRLGLDGYRALWDPTQRPRARWWMEGSTSYTKLPERPSPAFRLSTCDAEFRFIYLTRNPVERVRSHYEHAWAEGWLTRPIHERLDVRAVWISNYYMQIRPFVDCFGRDAVHVLSHEELSARPKQTLLRVCEFLDLDPSAFPLALSRANTGEHHRSRSLLAARRRATKEGRDASDEVLAEELRRAVTPTDAVIEELHAQLDVDLGRFEAEFGIDPWTGRRTHESAATAA